MIAFVAARRALLAALACCSSCSDVSRTAKDGAVLDAGRSPEASAEASSGYLPSQLPANFHCDPTLESLRDTIFVTSCGYDSCHGDNNFAYGLWLTADVDRLTSELVGAPSQSCKPEVLVVPGDSTRSFLYDKLSSPNPKCGHQMPYGIEPLPDSALGCVRGWIESLTAPLADSGAPGR
ncbi:MAG TPA: hypothetical protein VHC69_01010 [Polyangiaceae bacterium]|nr:hypothetical protein [Polyangiaceae bacterium]